MRQSEFGAPLRKAQLSGSATLSAQLSAVYEATGRVIDGNENHALAQAWATETDSRRLHAHPGAIRWNQQLAALASGVALNAEQVAFRCRPFGEGESPSASEFGPPKTPHHGRYSLNDSAVLYLSSEAGGARREIVASASDRVWCQRFIIPNSIRVVDFTALHSSSFEASVLWFAELANDSEPQPATFAFSQTVSRMVASEFDSMLVPGVRGDQDFRYSNLVVFRPEKLWRSWLDHSWRPKPQVPGPTL